MQQGSSSIDDAIRKYLPELPDYATAITVRHLIHHTSGLRDYNTLLSIAGRRGDEAFDNLTVLRITARQKKLNFQPGAEYPVLEHRLHAARADRRARNRDAVCAVRGANIFKPLGMRSRTITPTRHGS